MRKGKIHYLDEKELLFPSPTQSSSTKATKVLTTREKGKIDTKRPTSHPRAPKQAEKEIRILEMKTTTPQSLTIFVALFLFLFLFPPNRPMLNPSSSLVPV
jgi:hypothetical protein